MPICPGKIVCKGVGKWEVKVITPSLLPPYVFYKYPGESEGLVLYGESWNNEIIQGQFLGGNCPTDYYVVIQVDRYNSVDGFGGVAGTLYDSPILDRYNKTGPLTFNLYLTGNPPRTLWDGNQIVGNSGHSSFFHIGNPRIYQVYRRDGTSQANDIAQCGNQEELCKFTVYDGNDNIIFTRTESVCPTASAIDKKCVFDVEACQLTLNNIQNDGILLLEEVINNQGKYCVRLFYEFKTTKDNTIRCSEFCFECSRLECPEYPRVQVKCTPLEQKCPSKTCYECQDGNTVCCYDQDSNLIYSFQV